MSGTDTHNTHEGGGFAGVTKGEVAAYKDVRYVVGLSTKEPTPLYAKNADSSEFTCVGQVQAPPWGDQFIGTDEAVAADGQALVVDAFRGIGVPCAKGDAPSVELESLLSNNMIGHYGLLLDSIDGLPGLPPGASSLT